MPKPMTLVLWGSIITILGALIGGTIVAIGKYRQDISSSKKSDIILFNVEEGLGISKITKEGVKELIDQKNELDRQVNNLLIKQSELKQGQDSLNEKLEPFIAYANKMFPNVSTDEALTKLETLLKQQVKRIDKTEDQVGKLEKDVTSEKDKTKPQLTLKNWKVKNQIVTKVPKAAFFSIDFFDVQEKFSLDHVVFNQVEFEYKTEISRSEYMFVLNRDDVVYCLINIKNGAINSQQVTSKGRLGFRLNQPQSGEYVLKFYTKSDVTDLNKLILSY